jgi:filamentous hemagglutinin
MSVSLPTRDSQLRHIFCGRSGHIEDTPENRELLIGLANDVTARLESDQHGNIWAAR